MSNVKSHRFFDTCTTNRCVKYSVVIAVLCCILSAGCKSSDKSKSMVPFFGGGTPVNSPADEFPPPQPSMDPAAQLIVREGPGPATPSSPVMSAQGTSASTSSTSSAYAPPDFVSTGQATPQTTPQTTPQAINGANNMTLVYDPSPGTKTNSGGTAGTLPNTYSASASGSGTNGTSSYDDGYGGSSKPSGGTSYGTSTPSGTSTLSGGTSYGGTSYGSSTPSGGTSYGSSSSSSNYASPSNGSSYGTSSSTGGVSGSSDNASSYVTSPPTGSYTSSSGSTKYGSGSSTSGSSTSGSSSSTSGSSSSTNGSSSSTNGSSSSTNGSSSSTNGSSSSTNKSDDGGSNTGSSNTGGSSYGGSNTGGSSGSSSTSLSDDQDNTRSKSPYDSDYTSPYGSDYSSSVAPAATSPEDGDYLLADGSLRRVIHGKVYDLVQFIDRNPPILPHLNPDLSSAVSSQAASVPQTSTNISPMNDSRTAFQMTHDFAQVPIPTYESLLTQQERGGDTQISPQGVVTVTDPKKTTILPDNAHVETVLPLAYSDYSEIGTIRASSSTGGNAGAVIDEEMRRSIWSLMAGQNNDLLLYNTKSQSESEKNAKPAYFPLSNPLAGFVNQAGGHATPGVTGFHFYSGQSTGGPVIYQTSPRLFPCLP